VVSEVIREGNGLPSSQPGQSLRQFPDEVPQSETEQEEKVLVSEQT